jgi:hypothetical protein
MSESADGGMESRKRISMKITLTHDMPVRGPEYDKARPETRQPWLDFRSGGITATEIRDWGIGSRRREILESKVSGKWEDLSHIDYVDHGNRREPIIANWVQGKFGIEPCDASYHHAKNPRHIASPDGISLDPFTRELVVGGSGAIVSEIKTSSGDLTPGEVDNQRVLASVAPGSLFEKKNYYTQMQWQMYVMNAIMTLFVWEQHTGQKDPDTGTFIPNGPPQYVWIPRDEGLIDILLNKVAPKALAEIDAARVALKPSDLPPASEFPSEDAVLVQEVLQARDTEATAKSSKERAWNTLNAKYVGEGKPDIKVDLGFANFTVSTSTSPAKSVTVEQTDYEAMARRAPKLVAQYEALKARYTKPEAQIVPGKTTQRLTITEKKHS